MSLYHFKVTPNLTFIQRLGYISHNCKMVYFCQIGFHDPEVLNRTMWYLLTLHFGQRANYQKARQLKYADIQIRKDEAIDEEYLERVTERHSKTRHSDEHEKNRAFHPKAFAAGDDKCPVPGGDSPIKKVMTGVLVVPFRG